MDIYRLVYTIFRRCALNSLFLFQFIPAGGNTRFLWQDQLLPRYDMGRGDQLEMFCGILSMSLLGLSIYEICHITERVLCRWKRLENRR